MIKRRYLVLAAAAAACLLGAAYVGAVWHRYEEPKLVGAQVSCEAAETEEEAARLWFQTWVQARQGWRVPPSQRLKDAEIWQAEEVEDGYVEVHYQADVAWWNQSVVRTLELIDIGSRGKYDGQWVLCWRQKGEYWELTEVMSPVQYQLQSEEMQIERQQPQITHYAYSSDKEESYYVQDGVLYVTYDGGEHFQEVQDGYERVLNTPNGVYDEYLSDHDYLISRELTAFVGYDDSVTRLIYSTDAGQSWKQSIICRGGYRASSFLSRTEGYCYVTFALDRTGGSDYYGTYRSADLENWVSVPLPQELLSNVTGAFWMDDQTGYYGKGDQFCLTRDGGETYEWYDLPPCEERSRELGYDPYDTLELMYREGEVLYMVVGQGPDGDYARDGKLMKALFRSEDGIHFTFVEEMPDERTEAG